MKAPGTPPGAEGTEAPRVLPDLQQFYNNQSRLPDGRVVLCFGEEFPDMSPLRSKLILVQVSAPGPLFESPFIPGLGSRQQGVGDSTCGQRQAWGRRPCGASGFLPPLSHPLLFHDS